MTPRPKPFSDEVWAKADAALREALGNVTALEECNIDEAMQSIRNLTGFDFDGYKVARRLEDDLVCDCTLQDAEALDGLDDILRRNHAFVVMEWVKAEGIVSPFQIGDRVKFHHRRWSNREGVVEKIDAEMAKLTVKVEGENGKPIINFEDAEKV